jgi:hypothetical protein
MTPTEEVYSLVPLTRDQFAIASMEDWMRLMAFRWWAVPNTYRTAFLAARMGIGANGKRKLLYMHREVLGLSPGDPRIADHINHDTLDNRRSNLRIATAQENMRNKSLHSNSSTGFKGVQKTPNGRYKAMITIDYTPKYLGTFDTPEEAHAIYCAAATKYFGSFACFE